MLTIWPRDPAAISCLGRRGGGEVVRLEKRGKGAKHPSQGLGKRVRPADQKVTLHRPSVSTLVCHVIPLHTPFSPLLWA